MYHLDGGFQVDLKQLRGVKESVLKLSTIGLLITFLGITIFTYFFIGVPLQIAPLFGAYYGSGPSVVGPIIRNIHVCHTVGNSRRLEYNVILIPLVFEWITAELSRIGQWSLFCKGLG